MDIEKYLRVATALRIDKTPLSLELELNNSTTALLRSPLIPLERYLEVKESENLTVITYKIGTGFADVVLKNIAECNGVVNLVFGLTDKPNIEKIAKQINSAIKTTNATINILISNKNHIKLFARDRTMYSGSQNFSASTDKTNPDDVYFYNLEDLILKIENNDDSIIEKILNHIQSSENKNLAKVTSLTEEEIKEIIIEQNSISNKTKHINPQQLTDYMLKEIEIKASEFICDDYCYSISHPEFDNIEDSLRLLSETLYKKITIENSIISMSPDSIEYAHNFFNEIETVISDLRSIMDEIPKAALIYDIEAKASEITDKEFTMKYGEGFDFHDYQPHEEKKTEIEIVENDLKVKNKNELSIFCKSFNEQLKQYLESLI